MATYLNANELKEGASVVILLDNLGYKPVKKSGKEHFYRSMLRDGDSNPSFTVNDKVGVWYDHGTGKGGNIIDFGVCYWPNLSFSEVVDKINASLNNSPVANRPSENREKRSRITVKKPGYCVESVKEIGTHPAITDYLKSRGLFDVARTFLKEIYYYVEDEQGSRKQYFAAGWPNEHNAWEVRNRYFKGSLGPKGITLIPGDIKKLAVFEGYLNFLSWKTEHPGASHSVLVLNTTALLRQGIAKALLYSDIDLYFDRDKTGFDATAEFTAALPYAKDKSEIYAGFNDYNKRLIAQMQGQSVPARAAETGRHRRSV